MRIFGVPAAIVHHLIRQTFDRAKARYLKPLLIAGALFSPMLAASAAHAEFRVCNGTQNLVGVAVGYRAEEGWITEGWWQVPAGTCATLIEGELQSRYYYLYAEDAARGGRWTGDINMCVAENEFKIVGVKDCFARGYQQR